MAILREFHPYRTAFIDERALVKKELLKSEKYKKWEKKKFDASTLFSEVKNHEDFEKNVVLYNVFPMVFKGWKDIKEETLIPCQLFDGHEAWIGKDARGQYRYFTGKPFDEAIGYTVFDLLLCFPQVKGKGYTQQRQYVRNELIDLLNVSFEDTDWERKEKNKYIENIQFLVELKNQDFQQKYPKLFQKIKTYLDVHEKMLEHGQKHIDITRKDKNGNAYFTLFASQSGVSSYRFRNAVERLNELGLLFCERQKVTYFNKDFNANLEGFTTCYSFPPYSNQLFDEIEKKLTV